MYSIAKHVLKKYQWNSYLSLYFNPPELNNQNLNSSLWFQLSSFFFYILSNEKRIFFSFYRFTIYILTSIHLQDELSAELFFFLCNFSNSIFTFFFSLSHKKTNKSSLSPSEQKNFSFPFCFIKIIWEPPETSS